MGPTFDLNFATLNLETGREETIVEIKNSRFSSRGVYFKWTSVREYWR